MDARYRIVPAGPEHIGKLPGIELTAATMFPPGRIPESNYPNSVPHGVFVTAAREDRLLVAVETGSGEPVGFALNAFGCKYALLSELDVLPEHGRRGIGRELVRRVGEKVRVLGYTHLHLTTFSDFPWNAPFYATLGFETVPEDEMPELLQHILADERARGFINRVAMRLRLDQTTAG